MSSLICNATTLLCIFTRVDTDGFAIYPPPDPNRTAVPTLPTFTQPPVASPAPSSTPPPSVSSPPISMDPPRRLESQEASKRDPNNHLRRTEEEEPQSDTDDGYEEGEDPPSYFDDDYHVSEDTTLAPWTNPVNQDRLSDTVAITRDFRRGIFNAFESPYDQYEGPSGTEWVLLPEGETFIENRCSLQFGPWRWVFARGNPPSMVGQQGVVHLTNEDVYYHIKFLSWTRGQDREDNGSVSEQQLGGGFSYERDAEPFSIPEDAAECPVCRDAMPDKTVLTPRDGSMEEVRIVGVTPDTAGIEIIGISQESNPACNMYRGNYVGTVMPNADGVGTSSAFLRKTGERGSLRPFRYTVHFRATTAAGYCLGSVNVCVPADGFSCDDYSGQFDATSEEYCDAPSYYYY